MNRNIFLIALVLITAGLLYLFFDTGSGITPEQGQTGAKAPDDATTAALQEQALAADRKRRAAMRSAYAELEQARNDMRLQLGRLKTRLWKVEVSPARARAIRDQLQQGYAALKNPPMLGAFSSVDEIRQELARVTVLSNRLASLELTVQEAIAAREER